MTKEEQAELQVHIERHKMLHNALDELVADFIGQTDNVPSRTTVLELMRWSSEQVKNPTVKK